MKVSMDPDKCIGAAQCTFVAPTVFDLDDFGKGAVIDGADLPSLRDDIATAVAQCPSGALSVDED